MGGIIMTLDITAPTENKEQKKKTPIIDCDIHVQPESYDVIRAYMKQPHRDAFRFFGRGNFDNPFTQVRPDALSPKGGPIGSDHEFVRKQLIEPYGTETAILHPWIYADYLANPDLKAEVCSAYNQWLNDTWLSKYNPDGLFKASIVVSHHDPNLAVKEIEKWAGHPHFIQVLFDVGARAPFGQRHYWPIYEAASRHGLPIAYHPGSDGLGSNPSLVPGFPTRFIEWGTTLVNGFISHLVSLLTEGVFQKYPNLKIVSLEGGSAWVPGIMYRLDSHYKSFRFEVPWVTKLPSLYLKDHVRFGSQPLERPMNDKHMLYFLEMMDAENLMMFTSDYPHYDTDHPQHMFPSIIPDTMKERILYKNAKEFYNL
jgi:predicted TIM-barrel fold metal-dependent hydrolase